MSIGKIGPLLLVVVAAGATSPALADCCSSFWDCAATIVTEGVSCEVETIIDTIKTLVTEVNNFSNDITGTTSATERAARAYVSNTITLMQSQSQQGDSDLTTALSQTQALYKEENAIIPLRSATGVSQNLQAVAPAAITAPPRPQTAQMANRNLSGGAPASMTAQRSQAMTATGAAGNGAQQTGILTATTQVAGTAQVIAAPHGTYADAFARAVKQLTVLKSAGDTDLSKVNQYLAQAQSSEGPGVAAADTIMGAMNSPITAIESQLSSMLTHPLDAFDPSSIVDDMEKTITSGMSSNIQQMVNDITVGPTQQFNAAQPTFDDLLARAESAQQLAAAVADLYRLRTTAAANALYALLPKIEYAGVTTKATAPGNVAANFGQRQSYALISANNAAAKQKLLAVTPPASLARIHTLVLQFKQQRSKGKSPLAQALMVNYRSNFSSQLNTYFSGKSPAAAASQRDQLIAQARTRYAGDPATGNGVIALLNSEAAKRGVTTNAASTVAPLPGQPVPTLASQNAPSVKPQAAAPAWGASPAPTWTPTAAAGAATSVAPSTFKATTTLKSVQPIQPQTPQPALQAAPSSLGR
jgi:hypothetical protein